MTQPSGSLRARLFIGSLGPMLVDAIALAMIRFTQFVSLSRTLYDNVLYTAALTISRDVALNQGDLLTKSVLDTLAHSLGDRIYYRIKGPGGA